MSCKPVDGRLWNALSGPGRVGTQSGLEQAAPGTVAHASHQDGMRKQRYLAEQSKHSPSDAGDHQNLAHGDAIRPALAPPR